jgi:hypothetical protein
MRDDEACRIVILLRGPGVVDVAAPMKHKPLCYDLLRDARTVIERTPAHLFRVGIDRIIVVMDMSGTVDVAAPLPNRDLCYQMLRDARNLIERYEAEVVPDRAFSPALLGD